MIAEDLTLGVGSGNTSRVLLEDFSASISRGDVLGLIGANGSGKSTLLRALVGEHVGMIEGELRLGGSIVPGYYRQDLAQVPLDSTLYETIAALRPAWERRLIQGHLGRFGFSGDEVQRRAGSLSGGERARVALAMLMLSRANLLMLDEPTNHLDVESIEALEDALEDYGGTVILVSHDRELLRAVTTKLWVLHERRITLFDGGFADWEVVSAERAHGAAVRASEDAALRRVHERQQLDRARREPRDDGGRDSRTLSRDLRRAQRALREVEAEIATLESRVRSLTTELDAPALYVRAGGVDDAARLGAELEEVKRALEHALERWGSTSEEVEVLGRARSTSET